MPHFPKRRKRNWSAIGEAGNIDLGVGTGPLSREEPVAQPVEHLTFNQRVVGSNPAGLTNSYNGLAYNLK